MIRYELLYVVIMGAICCLDCGSAATKMCAKGCEHASVPRQAGHTLRDGPHDALIKDCRLPPSAPDLEAAPD